MAFGLQLFFYLMHSPYVVFGSDLVDDTVRLFKSFYVELLLLAFNQIIGSLLLTASVRLITSHLK